MTPVVHEGTTAEDNWACLPGCLVYLGSEPELCKLCGELLEGSLEEYELIFCNLLAMLGQPEVELVL